MVLATGVTATTGVAAVLSDAAMSSTDVSALLAVLVEAGGHLCSFFSLQFSATQLSYYVHKDFVLWRSST